MPYQERQIDDGSHGVEGENAPVVQAQQQPNSGKTVQIIIVLGLLAAIVVAIFGTY